MVTQVMTMDRKQARLKFAILASVGLIAGCSNRGSIEVLESQLRDREDQISELQADLTDHEHDLRAANEEADMLRQQLVSDEKASAIELTNGVVRVTQIRIHPLLTGPLDTDDDGVIDELVVLLQPRDQRDKTVEAVGNVHVELRQGQRSIDHWVVTPEQASEQWRDSKLGAGMMLRLPLTDPLPPGKCEVTATLDTANGRTFTAQHNMTP